MLRELDHTNAFAHTDLETLTRTVYREAWRAFWVNTVARQIAHELTKASPR